MSKFNVGDKVVFTNAGKHKDMSWCYPKIDSIGIIRTIGYNKMLVDWGDAEGIDFNSNETKSWWCHEDDVKPLCDCEEREYTDDEVWEMLKPKMRKFVPTCIIYSPIVKKMVVVAYRSGYGRATKGRSFMIKPKADEKPSVEKSIDDVLGGKMIVTIYTDRDDSYSVSKFDHALHTEQGMEIHSNIIYDSDGNVWGDGFDVISDPDCEMYVAIPFSEAIGRFNSDFIKALYCEKSKALCHIKPWTIGKYNGMMYFSNRTCAFVEFKHEDGNSLFYPEIHRHEFKALVPICDYLRVNGVNV